MRVICISHDDEKIIGRWAAWRSNDPQIGDECEVQDRFTDYTGVEMFELFGFPMWYSTKCFAEVSEIDETTFERNFKKELV